MSDTLWVDVRGRADDDLPADNSIMLRLQGPLDGLCERLGVARLSDFYDASELAAAYADDPNEGGEAEPPAVEPRWFDPGPALAAVRALVARLEAHPDALGFRPDASRAHWPGHLMEELRGCATVLEEAAARGQPFRFLLVA